jgi:hypothetical protein
LLQLKFKDNIVDWGYFTQLFKRYQIYKACTVIKQLLLDCSLGHMTSNEKKGFPKGSSSSVFLAFFQSYVKHDLRKNKIVVPFFYQQINFYELIFRSNTLKVFYGFKTKT